MQKNLMRIQAQIDKLQRQANEIRSKEIAGVIKRMQTAIQYYDLTAEDVFGKKAAKPARKAVPNGHAKVTSRAKTAKRHPVAVKYRDDEGNTWTGRGSQPRWLAAHLKTGRKISNFAVSST